jgi:hypothetical protein
MKRGLIRRTGTCFLVVLVGVATQLAAQDKPDFSGSWVLESGAPSAGDIPQGLSVSQSLARTNVRGEPMKPFFKDITVTRAFESGTRSETYQIGVEGGIGSFRADGSSNGPRIHHRVVWEEQALIIERGSYTGPTPESGEWTERREVWLLDSGGRLRLAITTRSSVADSRTVILVYRRQ